MNIRIHVNGEPRVLPPESSVADLVEALGLRPEQVAIEVNKRLVGRDDRTQAVLADGDRVELVTLVGGG